MMNSCTGLRLRWSLFLHQLPRNRSGRLVRTCFDPRSPPRSHFCRPHLLTLPIMIQPYSPRLCICDSPCSVSSSIKRGVGVELTNRDAYRVPPDSFASEDDAIYGGAGGTTPTDANGDTNGGNEEEEAHESENPEEEEEDSEDVSHTAQPRRFF